MNEAPKKNVTIFSELTKLYEKIGHNHDHNSIKLGGRPGMGRNVFMEGGGSGSPLPLVRVRKAEKFELHTFRVLAKRQRIGIGLSKN